MGWQNNINCNNLTIARENIGLSTQEATGMISKSKEDKVATWEAGQITEKSPTYKQLEKLADKYNVSVAQFFIEDNLSAFRAIPAYRSSTIEESYYLKRFISLLRIRQSVIRHNMQLDETPVNPLVGSGRNYKSPYDLAEFIRERVGYYITDLRNKKALQHLRDLLEKQYIFVFKNTVLRNEKIEISEMRGIYINDKYAPVIALNREDTLTGQLFTLAHELIHLFRGQDNVESIDFRNLNDIKNAEEVFCNQAAAQFLMPQSEIAEQNYVAVKNIQDLAKKFQVSHMACFYRLKDLGYLDKSKINRLENYFRSEVTENLANRRLSRINPDTRFSPHGSIKAGNGNLFNEYIFSLHLDNRLSAAEAQKLLRLPLGSF